MEAALAPQLFIRLTPKAAWYRLSILGQGSECKYNEALLSSTLVLSIQCILNVAKATVCVKTLEVTSAYIF